MNRKAILAALRRAVGGTAKRAEGVAENAAPMRDQFHAPSMYGARSDDNTLAILRKSRAERANSVSVVDNEFDRPIPPLRRHEGSWMVTSPSGEVRELYTEANVKKAIAAGWKVETAGTYLGRINQDIRGAQ